MDKKDVGRLLIIFIIWRLTVIAFADLGQLLFSLQTNYLGGGLLNYLRHPLFWGFINFDGEHYLSIAYDGYFPLTYFYFPLYSLIIKLASEVFGGTFTIYALAGLLLSNLFLVIALMGLYKLANLHCLGKTALYSIIVLLIFPTSFYFGAYYNESFFLALVIWSFYFAFTKKWFLSFLLCGLATSTRLVGVAIIPALLYEYIIEDKNKLMSIKLFIYSLLSISGVVIYSVYLKIITGDFLAFFHNVEIFGGQRSTNLVILPQVFYRYFFKILPVLNYINLPQVFMSYLEITSAIVFLIAAYFIFIKMKKSLFIYYICAYLIPTLAGSFSSFPRYALALFPAFILAGEYLSVKSRLFRNTVYTLLIITGFIAVSLFIRGYFVS